MKVTDECGVTVSRNATGLLAATGSVLESEGVGCGKVNARLAVVLVAIS
jgi:hypothetical protein